MNDLLRSVWREPRPPHAPRRVWRDWVLVGFFVPATVLEGLLRPDLQGRAVTIVVAVGLVPTLLWRRTRPLLMITIAFVAGGGAALVIGAEPDLVTLAYLVLLPYSVFRWGSGREMVLGSAIMLGRLGLSLVVGHVGLGDTAGGLVVVCAAAALGTASRYRTRARLRELDQIKLLERERLARDLHDTVAHHVSAMAIRAKAGLATAASRPEAATDALRLIESEASRALTEMRTMVRALRRDQPADLAPSPRIRDLERLARHARPGPPVEVELTGDVDDLPPPVAAAIYRLAQESVTNARRHARHATRVQVRVEVDDTSVRLRVSDDGDTSPTRSTVAPGYGLLGMIERADLLGGTCEAGPAPGRGWTVTAVLPRTGSAS